jgi:hypothetical protein
MGASMRSGDALRVIALWGALSAALWLWGCESPSIGVTGNPASPSCGSCHPGLFQQWRDSAALPTSVRREPSAVRSV